MPKVSEAHRESRREQIVAAALACFAEKGFQRTSVADISAAAHLSPGAIYLLFESKQQIALTAGREVLSRRLGELADREHPPADPVEAMRSLLGNVLSDLPETRLLVQLWGEATSDPEMAELVQEIFGGLQQAWRGYLETWARDRGEPDPAAWAARAVPAVLALAQGFLLQRALFPDFDADAYFASVGLVAGATLRREGRPPAATATVGT